MSRRFIILLLVFANLLSLSGCWDKRESSELGIVSGIGIEQTAEGKVRVILQFINPSAASKGSAGRALTFEKAYRNGVVEGDTVYDALNKMNRQAAKQVFLSHSEVILVSEDFARQRGLREVLDGLERDPKIRPAAWLLIGRGDLVALLDTPGRLEVDPTGRIRSITNEVQASSFTAPLRMGEFIRLMQSGNTQPYTAAVESVPNPSLPREEGHGLSSGIVPEPTLEIRETGAAVFRQDKMVGLLNEKESRGLLWVRGEVRGGSVVFAGPEGNGRLVSARVVRSKTELKPEIRDGGIYMTVKVYAETRLEETQASIDLTFNETVRRLEAAEAEKIQDEIMSALNRAQREYQVDIFGFGEAVHRRYPREWREMKETWPEQFPAVQVQLEVKTKILSTGTVNSPLEVNQR